MKSTSTILAFLLWSASSAAAEMGTGKDIPISTPSDPATECASPACDGWCEVLELLEQWFEGRE